MPLNSKTPKGICKKGTKNAYAVTSSDKSQITVVACVSAAGWSLPPMVIWDRKTMQADMLKGQVHGTLYAFSSNGWIDQELFDLWFHNLFIKYAPSVRPLILLMDGHTTHYSPDTIRLAAKHKITLFVLPPNTTHLTQPLDKGYFASLKTKWGEECHKFIIENPGKVMSRFSFSSIFRKVWMEATKAGNIQPGFEVTGIFPLDRTKLLPRDYFEDSAEEEDLAYMPMLTPTRQKRFEVSESNAALLSSSKLDPESNYMYKCTSRPLEEVLSYPTLLYKVPMFKPKQSSQIITSDEFIEQMETKQREKALKAHLKEERKYLRELKTQETCNNKWYLHVCSDYSFFCMYVCIKQSLPKKEKHCNLNWIFLCVRIQVG